ncbi:MAG: hypothetical protein QOE77_720 [Blastocatellia bacterium]|jgi:hypothetical protein|nr:hypothetical protein [Blastocatellia bacterium]
MSELREKHWAVISERGAEASGLAYAEARELVQQLVAEGLHGLAIITASAANRVGRLRSADVGLQIGVGKK